MLKRNALRIGPVVRSDCTYTDAFRVGEDGALIVSRGLSAYGSPTARGWSFSVFTALTGTTVVTDNVAPPAAGAATILSILNPVGSGVNLEIIKGWVFHLSGKPTAGFWAWCGANPGVAVTAAEAGATKGAGRVNDSLPAVRAWSQALLTGGTVHTNIRPFPTAEFAAALDGTQDLIASVDNVDGGIVLTPGAMITLAPPGVDGITPEVVAVGIKFLQVPRHLRAIT